MKLDWKELLTKFSLFLAQITGPQQSQKRRVSCSLAARATCCRFLATEALLAKLLCTVLAQRAISITEIHTRDGKSDSDGALRALVRSAEALGMIDLCARAVAQLLNNSSCTIAQPVAILLKRQWVLVLLQFSYMGNSFSLAALQMYYHGFYYISQTFGIGTIQLRSYAFVCVFLLLQTGSTGFL